MFLKTLSLILGAFIFCANVAIAQTYGCTDIQANNFSANATINDGSCTYNSTSYTPLKIIDKLSDTLNETSGIININGELWSMDDSGNPNTIYHFDKVTGAILQTVVIKNAVNHDWEEMTADANNIYIGDFGNNDGNRTALSVYKIARSQLSSKKVDTITAEIIKFSYADQTDFTSQHNANRFDCEAMFVWNDTLNLLSKDWVNGHARHYKLPTIPGTYSISPIDSMDAGFQVTGACIEPVSERIIFIGYKSGFCYIWMLWDFPANNIFNGNKRKIDLGFFTNTGQIEGVCFNDSNNIFITNENNIVNNKLYAGNVGQWMNRKGGTGIDFSKQDIKSLTLYPNPVSNEIILNFILQKPANVSYCIYNSEGKLVYCLKVRSAGGNIEQKINTGNLAMGSYYLLVHSDKMSSKKIIFVKQ